MIIDLLTSDTFRLSRQRTSGIISYLSDLYKTGLTMIRNLSDPKYDDVVKEIVGSADKIKSICDNIIESIDAFLLGQPQTAYKSLKSGLTDIETHLKCLFSDNEFGNDDSRLFRMREMEQAQVGCGELSHIPFEDRHKVGSQRYSVEGLPCLYLGGSLLVCWEELRRPRFHDVQMSAFRPVAPKIRVLNLSTHPSQISGLIGDEWNKIDAQRNFVCASIVCWPLIAACSLKVSTVGPFKVEYIVPKLVLQWIVNELTFDGVCYASTRLRDKYTNPRLGANYVFPVKTNQDSGWCPELSKMFKMTAPLGWALADAAALDPGVISGTQQFEVAKGLFQTYSLTQFSTMERRLNNLKLYDLPVAKS